MGNAARILLVMALLVNQAQATEIVNAREHQAFWLWSGVKASDDLQDAQTLYLHQGDIQVRAGIPSFQRLGPPVSQLTFPALWITVRFTTLDIPQDMPAQLVQLLRRWQSAGNHIVGLQVDFDAATRRLADYALFLRQLRQQLPTEFALGVTGLLDWAKTGDIDTLNTLPVDELVVQSYQGRQTVANYQEYLPALKRLRIPFKLGLVQNGFRDTQAEAQLHGLPYYRGTVVFMLNSTTRSPYAGSSPISGQ